MDVSVIIINYNTCELTKACIDSVFEKTKRISFEVILVDNASTDGSKRYFQNDDRITYIYNTENLGFGRANNVGIDIAKGRNILFLNSDTLLINDAISVLSEYLDENKDVGACGGNLYDKNMNPTHSYKRILPSIFWEFSILFCSFPERLLFGKNAEFNHSCKALDVGYITGADLMVPKHVLNDCGVFSPDFFMYYEETDLCSRIKKAKYKIRSVPSAQIIHLEGASSKQDGTSSNKNKIRQLEESRIIYYFRNCLRGYIRIVNIIYCLFLFSRLLLKRREQFIEEYRYRICMFRKILLKVKTSRNF